MTISVIVPAYDAATVIERAIASVLNQTLPALEIIVVDDASKDNTREVVRALSDASPQVKLVSLEANGGPSRARNVGFANAKGEWVAILDADDAWRPERLERLLEIAQTHNADFVADNQILYDATAEKEGRLGFVAEWKYLPLDVERFILSDGFADIRLYFPPLKPFLRREFLTKTGVKYDEAVRYGEDFKFHAEALFNGAKAILTSEPYYIYSTRVGEFSKTVSPYSKSNPRYDLLVDMSDDLENKYRELVTPEIAAAIEKRRSRLRVVHLANVARGIRQSRNYLKYAVYVLSRPDLFQLLARRLFRRLQGHTE